MKKKILVLTKSKTYSRKKSGEGYIFTGHRCDPQVWAQALELARRKDLKGNQLLNRLVHYAVAREWVPEYVENPTLPGYIPPREEEVPIPQTYSLDEKIEKA